MAEVEAVNAGNILVISGKISTHDDGNDFDVAAQNKSNGHEKQNDWDDCWVTQTFQSWERVLQSPQAPSSLSQAVV